MRRRSLSIVVLFAAAAAMSYAGLIGSSVNVSVYYPTTVDLYANGGNATVGAGLEYPGSAFVQYSANFSVDITDTQFILTQTYPGGLPFLTGNFNGFVLTVLSGPALVSASANPASSMSPLSVAISGNQLLVNYSGITDDSGHAVSIIDIATSDTAAPEPASWALVAAFALGLLLWGRKRSPQLRGAKIRARGGV